MPIYPQPKGMPAKLEKADRTKACVTCGVSYVPHPGARLRSKFCSRQCIRRTRPAMLQTTCTQCGATFKRTSAAIKRVKRTFCGKECQHAFFVGENSPMFRGDKDPNRGAAWNKIAAQIRRRDCYACRRCGLCEYGQLDKLSVDHVRPWRSFEDKDLANHPDNLVSLCRRCHSYKTTTVERAWLLGDRIAWLQWVRSLSLESAAFGWISGAVEVPVTVPPMPSNGFRERTHCKRGHEFTLENIFIRKSGARCCRTCIRLLASEYRKTDKFRRMHAAGERRRRAMKAQVAAV